MDMGGADADLTTEQGTMAVVDVVNGKGKEDNGKFFNILLKRLENNPRLNQHNGAILHW